MLEKNSDSEVHVEKVEQRPTGASIAFGLERLGLIAVQAPILSCIILVGLIIAALFGIDRIKIDDFAQPAVPVQFQGIPAVRGGDQALPGGRIRRAGRGRGQNAPQARKPRKVARSRHRSATRRRHARPDFAVLGAPGAGARQAAGGAVPPGPAAGRRLRQVHRDRQIQRDHPRQAAVRGRHAGADRAVAGAGRRRQQQARHDGRRYPQVDGRRSRRAAASTRNCRAFPSCSSKSATRSSATD